MISMNRLAWIAVLVLGITFLLIYFMSGEETRDQENPEDSFLAKIVPPLDCTPSDADGRGSAVLQPSAPVRIGSVGVFEITFTVEEPGIAPGGFLIFQVSPWWGWTSPQSLKPEYPGYTKVKASFQDGSIKVITLRLNRILVYAEERGFEPGETVTFSYGPARVDKFAENEELFQIFVDGDGDGHYACIKEPPVLRILPLAPNRLSMHGPSRASPGERLEIKIAPLDPMGNWTTLPPGDYTMRVDKDGEPLEGASERLEAEQRILSFEYTPPRAGVYFFEVDGPLGLKGRSNVLWCRKGRPSMNLYFGDIHGHTRLSDGTGTPEDYYAFAREVSGLDIAAVTDHADYGTIRVEGEVWERIKKAADDALEPGRFVTFLGYEWTNWVYGHRNVYYRDGDGPLFRSIDPPSDTPQELWKLIEPYEAMTVAHHVGGGPIHIDWSIPPGPKEWLVEICSIHGCSEYYGGEACLHRPVQGAFVRDALARGYRLGIIGSGDTHDGHPGKRSPGAVVTGILGVFAPELTREAVWDAFKRRHVYGTSGPKIILFFRVADSPMGSEVTWPKEKGALPIALMAVTCDDIEAVEIIRNGEVVFREKGQGVLAQLLIEDTDVPGDAESWYYARVLQKDGNMAWSSPVWVKGGKGNY